MQFQISTEPGGQRFGAEAGQTILEAALAAGVLLPHGCRDGACGACKALVLSGELDQGAFAATALSTAERAAGHALLCKAQPRSDLVIKVRNAASADTIASKKMPCRVESLERAAADVMIIRLKLPASEPFHFRAGQYIDFVLPDGERRSFSIANAPAHNDHLELHVRKVDGGRFTTQVFEALKPRDILRFEGPLGTFCLSDDDAARPAILLAGGTGFAPIKSIIEHAITSGASRAMTLYWGARQREGLYLDALARSWETALPGFRYVPVLSEAAEDGWTGRCGLVHEAIIADHPDLSGHEVYACGSPAMIAAARTGLTTHCGLPDTSFFADAFTFATHQTA